MPFRYVLAQDIRDVRSISGSQYNQGIQGLLNYYRDNFPNLMEKITRKPMQNPVQTLVNLGPLPSSDTADVSELERIQIELDKIQRPI